MVKLFFKLVNIVIFKSELEKYVDDWVVYLKFIVDFVKLGQGVWWKEMEDYIEFFDGLQVVCFR